MNQNNYVVPELQLVGDAADIVMGMLGVGIDPGNESLVGDMEFEAD